MLQLASLAALLLAWLFIFDITNKERASLEGFQEGIVGAVQDPAQAQVQAAIKSINQLHISALCWVCPRRFWILFLLGSLA